jgi:hypothetical protein
VQEDEEEPRTADVGTSRRTGEHIDMIVDSTLTYVAVPVRTLWLETSAIFNLLIHAPWPTQAKGIGGGILVGLAL